MIIKGYGELTQDQVAVLDMSKKIKELRDRLDEREKNVVKLGLQRDVPMNMMSETLGYSKGTLHARRKRGWYE